MQGAKVAQDELGDAVEYAFINPESLTKARSGKNDLNRTSVRRWAPRLLQSGLISMDEDESAINVMRKQSAYFKFALGARVRKPGDIGLAQDYIGIHIWKNLADYQGIKPDEGGQPPVACDEDPHEASQARHHARTASAPTTALSTTPSSAPRPRGARRAGTIDRSRSGR